MGSGTNVKNIEGFLKYADGAIVGSSLKKRDHSENPVDIQKVKEYMAVVKSIRDKLC